MRPPKEPTRPLLANEDVDPRLVHAQQGQFTTASFSEQLSAAEDSHYKRQNSEYERQCSLKVRQANYGPAVSHQNHVPSHMVRSSAPSLYGSPYPNPPPVQQPPASPGGTTSMTHCIPQTEDLLRLQLSSSTRSDVYRLPYFATQHATPQPRRGSYEPTPINQVQNEASSTPSLRTGSSQSKMVLPTYSHWPTVIAPHSFVANITAHERDAIAQGIIRRQQTMTENSSVLPLPTNAYNLPKSVPSLQYPAQATATGCAIEPRMTIPAMNPYAVNNHAQAANNHGTASTQQRERVGLPTLEQVRSRYHPSQQQSSSHNHQLRPPLPVTAAVKKDVLEQLQNAAASQDRSSTQH